MERIEIIKSERIKKIIIFLNSRMAKISNPEERESVKRLINEYIDRYARCENQNKEIRQLRSIINNQNNELLEQMVEDKTWEIEANYEKQIKEMKEELEYKDIEIKRLQNLYEIQCQTNARMVNEFLDKK